MNRVVESALRVTEHRLRPHAEVATGLGEGVVARANERQLEQVLVNLLLNAAEALPAEPGSRGHVLITTHRTGDTITIDVADDGQGIPRELQARIFDPFFTTKATGAGTGLGLAISHKIVTQFGGKIAVDSAPARGTTFRVTLPAADLPAVAAPSAALSASPSPRSASRILLVDDEPAILNVLRLMLDEHVVFTARSGAEGLRIVGQQEFDAVVCDIAMPGMNGIELARRIHEVKPRLASRVIFASGNLAAWAADLAQVPHAGCLEKPFGERALRALLEPLVGIDN